jgi:hypothetical protein
MRRVESLSLGDSVDLVDLVKRARKKAGVR